MQRQCQRFESGFAGDLAFGAALRFVRQIQIFEFSFVLHGADLAFQLRGQLALIGNAFQDRATAIFQFAQIAKSLFKIAQIGVGQATGDFFPVTGNERHSRAFIKQGDGGIDLLRTDIQFGSNALRNIQHGKQILSKALQTQHSGTVDDRTGNEKRVGRVSGNAA